MAKINQTSVAAGTSGYRRGVIFGLTMAEVLLLILFCLLLAYQLTYDQLAETEEKMKETTLSEQNLIAKNQQLQDKIVQLEDRNNKLVDEIAKNTPTDNRLVQAIQTNLTALKVNSPDKYKELSEKIKNNPESLYTSTFVEVEWLQDATTLEQFVDKFMTSDLYPIANEKVKADIALLEERIKVITILERESPELLASEENIKEVLIVRQEKIKIEQQLKMGQQLIEELRERISTIKETMTEESRSMATVKEENIRLKKEKIILEQRISREIEIVKEANIRLTQTNKRLININKNLKTKDKLSKGPPIINLPEADDYSFETGRAILSFEFSNKLRTEIKDKILKNLIEYEADIIEVIGHTDEQAMRKTRQSNLDQNTVKFIKGETDAPLKARDNAGLGLARAASVVKELKKLPELANYTILPYSAGQLILPNENLSTGDSFLAEDERRRIEIRVRRRKKE